MENIHHHHHHNVHRWRWMIGHPQSHHCPSSILPLGKNLTPPVSPLSTFIIKIIHIANFFKTTTIDRPIYGWLSKCVRTTFHRELCPEEI